MNKNTTKWLAIILFVLSIFACNDSNKPSSTDQAKLIQQAINNNNITQLQNLSTLPIIVREQEWVTASDGYGFALGTVKQIKLTTSDEFKHYFKSSIKPIHIDGENIITEDITLSMFSDELKDQKQHWANLKLHLFVRGKGDVEHIVLLGLEKDTDNLRAIYIN